MSAIGDALYSFFGLSGTGPVYAAWSGPGADITELAIVGGIVSIYRKHQCHVRGCWRIGRHGVEGTAHVVCARHHPDGAPTAAEVLAQHEDTT